MKLIHTLIVAAALSAIALTPASADPVTDAGRAAGQIGEQADGYLGAAPGQSVSADLRAHLDQINIRRRAAYTQRAQERSVSINDMAAAVGCEIFSQRVAVGEHYRDENGAWHQRTANQTVPLPSYCPR